MQESEEQQLFFMRWAIQLGEKGRCTAPPNPWVGCVIVKDGQMLGEGSHESAGKPHAEVIALEKAGVLARGATAFVSLEPCAHQGRTPPCVEALIAAGVRQVVVALLDPDPRVSGKGVEALRAAGIKVTVGIGKEDAAHSLRPYLHQRSTQRAYCVLKSAMSIDGRTAAADGSSQWIIEKETRADVHLLRAQSQAIIVGSQTALQDKPRLDVRGVKVLQQPIRVLVDSKGVVPPDGPLADLSIAPTWVFTSSLEHKQKWEDCGAQVFQSPYWKLKEILEKLGDQGVIQALVEGGSGLHSAFLMANLVDQVVLYMGNCLLGEQGKPLLAGLGILTIDQAPRWMLQDVRRFHNDIRLDFSPHIGL